MHNLKAAYLNEVESSLPAPLKIEHLDQGNKGTLVFRVSSRIYLLVLYEFQALKANFTPVLAGVKAPAIQVNYSSFNDLNKLVDYLAQILTTQICSGIQNGIILASADEWFYYTSAEELYKVLTDFPEALKDKVEVLPLSYVLRNGLKLPGTPTPNTLNKVKVIGINQTKQVEALKQDIEALLKIR